MLKVRGSKSNRPLGKMNGHDNDAALVPHSLENIIVPHAVDQHVDISKAPVDVRRTLVFEQLDNTCQIINT